MPVLMFIPKWGLEGQELPYLIAPDVFLCLCL
jgi:hypothetical protein